MLNLLLAMLWGTFTIIQQEVKKIQSSDLAKQFGTFIVLY